MSRWKKLWELGRFLKEHRNRAKHACRWDSKKITAWASGRARQHQCLAEPYHIQVSWCRFYFLHFRAPISPRKFGCLEASYFVVLDPARGKFGCARSARQGSWSLLRLVIFRPATKCDQGRLVDSASCK
jgi:hypothetical protein